MRSFAVGTLDGLSEDFVGWPVIGIKRKAEILRTLHSELIHHEGYRFPRLSVPRTQWRCGGFVV